MALKDLVRRGPRNIRRRLFRDIIVIILITVGAILLITLIQGKSIKDDISAQLISETSRLVKKRFVSYLTPYDTSLKILAQFGSSDVLQPTEAKALEQIFYPILDVHPDLKRITLMQETGIYQEFSRTDHGYETSTLKKWPKEDLSANPAFQGALSAPQKEQVFWSESFTSDDEETGLSASIRIALPHQSTALALRYFIPAEKIITFISDIEIDQNIDIVMFNNQGLFLSRWNLETIQGERKDGYASRQLPRKPKETDVVTLWQKSSAHQRAAQKIHLQGITYWAGFTPLSDDTTTWIGIIVPESAIIKNVYNQWLEL